MNLKQLEAYVEVADSRSFSKAAKKLYLTQPTVSAHIATLEKELNVRLFVRSTKDVNLSEDGKKLYKYARQMIEIGKYIEQMYKEDESSQNKCIKIAASTIPAQYLLPEILADFAEKYPEEQFDIIESDSAKVVEAVVNHTIDIGFAGTVMEKKHCNYIPFYKDQLVVIVPNTEKYKKLVEKPLESWITSERMILREEGSGTRKEAVKLLKTVGISMEQLNVTASMENQEAIKRSVISGMGISVISKLAVKEEIEAGKLIGVPMSNVKQGRDINLVYNKNYHLSKSAEKLIRIVKKLNKV